MARFWKTGRVRVPGLEHSVIELPWRILRGADGPSDGSAGAASNVPSALAVLRHASLYLSVPTEIEEGFGVLRHHAMRDGLLYPVAVAAAPFLFDIVRRGSPIAERIADLIAEYASVAETLEPPQHRQLVDLLTDHGLEIAGWIGRYDRAVAAIAVHTPPLREELLTVISASTKVAPELLLALIQLGVSTATATDRAHALLERRDAPELARMAAGAYVMRFCDPDPELRTRIDAVLSPRAAALLRDFVHDLWEPRIDRPVVAPKLLDAEVVYIGEKVVVVWSGTRNFTLPWSAPELERGTKVKVGISRHGQAKLVVVTGNDGSVKVVDLSP